MVDFRYSMSFTTAALVYRESLLIAELFEELGDFRSVRDRVVAENLLQMRTPNASRRICSEIISRLKLLSPEEMAIIREGTPQEAGYVLWLGVCKRYRFIFDFAVEVVREKYLRLDFDLLYEDYDAFFNAKAEWHPEVDGVASSTRPKQRQFVFRMMREAELLSEHNRILPALLTPRLVDVIRKDDAANFSVFPVNEFDITQWTMS